MGNAKATCVGGYPLDEVVSALQKAIRRGKPRDALYWAAEMYLSGYAEYLWRRLFIIASEDIGPANPMVATEILSLRRLYVFQKAFRDGAWEHGLHLAHAVELLALSKKTRVGDWGFVNAFVHHDKHERLEVPPEALDKHTGRGRANGAGIREFINTGTIVENERFTENEQARQMAEEYASVLSKFGFDDIDPTFKAALRRNPVQRPIQTSLFDAGAEVEP
jgi:replication-associated recombination protein RarA